MAGVNYKTDGLCGPPLWDVFYWKELKIYKTRENFVKKSKLFKKTTKNSITQVFVTKLYCTIFELYDIIYKIEKDFYDNLYINYLV